MTPGMYTDAILFVAKGKVEVSFPFVSRNLHTYKRRAGWDEMEQFDRSSKMKKYPFKYRLTKKFNMYSEGILLPLPSVLPVFGGDGGIAS